MSERAIWTLVVSIIVVFALVALIMWMKFKSDKNQSNKRLPSFDEDTRGSASDRVAGIDRMRRQRNQNIERPESYHYSSRPSSIIYVGSQDNVRSISSQLSWYSQQLFPIPQSAQRPDGCLSFLDIPVVCPLTSIENVNEINDNDNNDNRSNSSCDNNTDNLTHCVLNSDNLCVDPCESPGNLECRTRTSIPTSPPPDYDEYYNVTVDNEESHITPENELIQERERDEPSVSPSPTYSECNDDDDDAGGINNTTPLTATDTLVTPPPTYTDSLSYNFITYV